MQTGSKKHFHCTSLNLIYSINLSTEQHGVCGLLLCCRGKKNTFLCKIMYKFYSLGVASENHVILQIC